MRARVLLSAVALAATAAACDTTGDPVPGPTVTETVTETATEAPDPAPVVGDACADLEGGESLAFVFVTEPAVGTSVQSGFTFSGCANAFEATYEWRLRDQTGAVIANGFGTATCGTGCVGTFQQAVAFSVPSRQVGSLEVFTTSPQDGSEVDLNAIPLVLEP